ncbi:hypothetical protein N2152v2_010788 [Parachlorella kessleri]
MASDGGPKLKGVIVAPPHGYRALVTLKSSPSGELEAAGRVSRNLTGASCNSRAEAAVARDLLLLWSQLAYRVADPGSAPYNFSYAHYASHPEGLLARLGACADPSQVQSLVKQLRDDGTLLRIAEELGLGASAGSPSSLEGTAGSALGPKVSTGIGTGGGGGTPASSFSLPGSHARPLSRAGSVGSKGAASRSRCKVRRGRTTSRDPTPEGLPRPPRPQRAAHRPHWDQLGGASDGEDLQLPGGGQRPKRRRAATDPLSAEGPWGGAAAGTGMPRMVRPHSLTLLNRATSSGLLPLPPGVHGEAATGFNPFGRAQGGSGAASRGAYEDDKEAEMGAIQALFSLAVGSDSTAAAAQRAVHSAQEQPAAAAPAVPAAQGAAGLPELSPAAAPASMDPAGAAGPAAAPMEVGEGDAGNLSDGMEVEVKQEPTGEESAGATQAPALKLLSPRAEGQLKAEHDTAGQAQQAEQQAQQGQFAQQQPEPSHSPTQRLLQQLEHAEQQQSAGRGPSSRDLTPQQETGHAFEPRRKPGQTPPLWKSPPDVAHLSTMRQSRAEASLGDWTAAQRGAQFATEGEQSPSNHLPTPAQRAGAHASPFTSPGAAPPTGSASPSPRAAAGLALAAAQQAQQAQQQELGSGPTSPTSLQSSSPGLHGSPRHPTAADAVQQSLAIIQHAMLAAQMATASAAAAQAMQELQYAARAQQLGLDLGMATGIWDPDRLAAATAAAAAVLSAPGANVTGSSASGDPAAAASAVAAAAAAAQQAQQVQQAQQLTLLRAAAAADPASQLLSLQRQLQPQLLGLGPGQGPAQVEGLQQAQQAQQAQHELHESPRSGSGTPRVKLQLSKATAMSVPQTMRMQPSPTPHVVTAAPPTPPFTTLTGSSGSGSPRRGLLSLIQPQQQQPGGSPREQISHQQGLGGDAASLGHHRRGFGGTAATSGKHSGLTSRLAPSAATAAALNSIRPAGPVPKPTLPAPAPPPQPAPPAGQRSDTPILVIAPAAATGNAASGSGAFGSGGLSSSAASQASELGTSPEHPSAAMGRPHLATVTTEASRQHAWAHKPPRPSPNPTALAAAGRHLAHACLTPTLTGAVSSKEHAPVITTDPGPVPPPKKPRVAGAGGMRNATPMGALGASDSLPTPSQSPREQ